MKILQITFTLSSGGAERFVVDLSNELVNYPNTEIVLLAVGDDTNPKNRHYLSDLDKRIKYKCVGSPRGNLYIKYWKVLKFIWQEKPDIVHIHCGVRLIYLPSIFMPHIKYVHTLHNLAEKCIKVKAEKFLNLFFYKHLIRPITISKTCQYSYKKLYHNNRSICITNGRSPILPTKCLTQVKKEIAAFKRYSTDVIFINVARCQPQKNHKLLFEAFTDILKVHSDLHLLVIGNGFEHSDFMKYNKLSNIHILGEKNNVGDYLLCSDFFILSSIYEGLPISLLEAMSCGVIPVSTSVGGIPDVIKDGVNGYLSQTLDRKGFRKTIIRALNGDVKKENVKKSYEDNYSMKVCASKYYKVYINS